MPTVNTAATSAQAIGSQPGSTSSLGSLRKPSRRL